MGATFGGRAASGGVLKVAELSVSGSSGDVHSEAAELVLNYVPQNRALYTIGSW